MTLGEQEIIQLERFLANSNFSTSGAVITDLDGTAVHEVDGRTVIHRSVEAGLKKMYNVGRPVVINTLRFPLSVIGTFAKEWWVLSNASIPVVLLNGSQLGNIILNGDQFAFQKLRSFPLTSSEIRKVIDGVKKLVNDGISDIVLFFYPDDWTQGEIIWTPDPERIPALREKYLSASSVISTTVVELEDRLLSEPVCMILLLLDLPTDTLMAYQHTRRSNFITHHGVDKLYGATQMAEELKFDLAHSIGAGDTDMDTFLKGVGLSVHVGNPAIQYEGLSCTLRLRDFVEFGDILDRMAEAQAAVIK